MVSLRKGDIIIANLEPVRGSEQRGIRPCLIIQNNIYNVHSPTIIIAAITSKKFNKDYPTNLSILKNNFGLEKDSTIMFNQIRTIDKSRIVKKIGSLPFELMQKVDSALTISFGINNLGKTF